MWEDRKKREGSRRIFQNPFCWKDAKNRGRKSHDTVPLFSLKTNLLEKIICPFNQFKNKFIRKNHLWLCTNLHNGPLDSALTLRGVWLRENQNGQKHCAIELLAGWHTMELWSPKMCLFRPLLAFKEKVQIFELLKPRLTN